ncbi:MAG: crotonase/enoyl-CoA hydratase family protein [Deltaproteobacteria bacterium]|jgi:enoyl-CoA hydratase/carnithine racemase|nr:crotonase/enoyl-CoA hydratase family protein [Deltaproteobacteria bacterium]MBW2537450.1 crotonase/enoyl-CoA hydratase family protein [Deltaproteobacteria bacterium]
MSDLVTIERRGHLLLIGVDRPQKRNAWNLEIIQAVARAYTDLAADDGLRVGVVHGHGPDFTAGLDLADVAPALAGGDFAAVLPEELCDPWDFLREPCPKPIVLAVQGRCFTLGIELSLASQVVVAAEDTVFAQLEVARGIFPFGGGTPRLGTRLGLRGLRWMLTAESFTAAEALEAGLVSEVVPTGTQLDRAIELAAQVADNAPLAVQAALAAYRAAERAGREAALDQLQQRFPRVLGSKDAQEGMAAMLERRPPVFRGE